jgi:hypothetical protein
MALKYIITNIMRINDQNAITKLIVLNMVCSLSLVFICYLLIRVINHFIIKNKIF